MAKMEKVTLALAWTDRAANGGKGKEHKAGEVVEVPRDVANNLVYFGHARRGDESKKEG